MGHLSGIIIKRVLESEALKVILRPNVYFQEIKLYQLSILKPPEKSKIQKPGDNTEQRTKMLKKLSLT